MWETNTFAASFHARLNVALQAMIKVKIETERCRRRQPRLEPGIGAYLPTGRAGCFNLS
jgi:hypothetical protein